MTPTITARTLEELLANTSSDHELVLLGQRIGAEALLVVLDTLGGCEVYIRSKESFFEKLYNETRDADIAKRWHPGKTHALAREYCITTRRILQIVSEQAEKNGREVES